MKGYKAFHAGWKCMNDFKYEIGKTYELEKGQKLEICKCGFHFCLNPIDVLGYYINVSDDMIIAEVEALGEIQNKGTKYCTDKIKIVKEFTREQLYALMVDELYNTGKGNTGSFNSGGRNTNTYNSGNFNSGSFNSGDYNTGDNNTGNFNSGDFNLGRGNAGDYNTGDHNVGSFNSGNFNSGNYNTGNVNSGFYNTGNYNTGMFNTDEPKMRMFNHQCDVTFSEFLEQIDYSFPTLLYAIHTNKLSDEDWERIKALPNFDSKIFTEITGIPASLDEDKDVYEVRSYIPGVD